MVRGVLLIAIDCLRSDHVSAYGYHRETTPTIDSLANQGFLWEKAYSASSWTKPSVTSILTGLYPSEHGAFEGIKRSKGQGILTTDVLQSGAPTLAETFAAAGWRCGAFINNAQLGEFTKLDRGFSAYAPMAGKADRLIGIFLEWLEADLKKPFFGYLHLLEAHWPYKPRRRHVAMFGGDRNTNHFRDFSARDYGRLRRAISQGETKLSDEQLEHMIQMYDGAVRRLDGKLKIILAMLKEFGLRDQTAIIVTADHGEEFLDHGRIGHGQSLYDELTHVPLVASVPDLDAGVRRPEPVSQVDLAATLLGIAGVPNGFKGRNLCASAASDRPVIGELRVGKRFTQSIRSDPWKLHRHFKFRPENGELARNVSPRSLIDNCPHDVVLELYDTSCDPAERHDLSAEPRCRDIVSRLVDQLDTWWREAAPADSGGGDVEVDRELEQRIRALGYMD